MAKTITSRYGIEIEFYAEKKTAHLLSSKLGDGWELIEEKLPSQYELISPILRYESDLSPIFKLLKEHNVNYDNNCGIHVHLDCRNKKVDSILKSLLYYAYAEESESFFEDFSLRKNDYCAPVASSFFKNKLAAENAKSIFELPLYFQPLNKSSAINLLALEKFGTIEYRALSAAASLEATTNWLSFLFSLM